MTRHTQSCSIGILKFNVETSLYVWCCDVDLKTCLERLNVEHGASEMKIQAREQVLQHVRRAVDNRDVTALSLCLRTGDERVCTCADDLYNFAFYDKHHTHWCISLSAKIINNRLNILVEFCCWNLPCHPFRLWNHCLPQWVSRMVLHQV